MRIKFSLRAIIAAFLCVALPSTAMACGNPSEKWFQDASEAIFDGVARCDSDARSCTIRAKKVFKNPLKLELKGQKIEVDFQNWMAEQKAKNSTVIIIACGRPRFEPEESAVFARFYANYDKSTGELIVRRYVPRGQSRN